MPVDLPEGGKFAFSIIDYPDTASVASVRPIYDLLHQLGIRASRAVWSFGSSESGKPDLRGSLEDPEHLDFALELQSKGHEICWGGASRGANRRERIVEGLDRFAEVLGHSPRVYLNASTNRESLYWGAERIDQPLLRAVSQRAAPTPIGYYQGHVNGSTFWWGDICKERIDYVLNLTFDDVNVRRVNPGLPYYDPVRPLVRWWFSAVDVESGSEFNQLLRPDRLERLVRENGCCIVSTRLTNGYLRDSQVERLTRKRLESVVNAGGWFATISTVLDHFRRNGSGGTLPQDEWDTMQRRFTRDLVRRRSRDDYRGNGTGLTAAAG